MDEKHDGIICDTEFKEFDYKKYYEMTNKSKGKNPKSSLAKFFKGFITKNFGEKIAATALSSVAIGLGIYIATPL